MAGPRVVHRLPGCPDESNGLLDVLDAWQRNPQRLSDLGSRLTRFDQLANLGPNGIGYRGALAVLGSRGLLGRPGPFATATGGLDGGHEFLEGFEAVGGWKGGQFLSQGQLEAGDLGLCIVQFLDA